MEKQTINFQYPMPKINMCTCSPQVLLISLDLEQAIGRECKNLATMGRKLQGLDSGYIKLIRNHIGDCYSLCPAIDEHNSYTVASTIISITLEGK